MATRACLALPLLGISVLLCGAAQAQLANKPPVPQWISPKSDSSIVEKHIPFSGKLLKAVLLVAGDGKLAIILNGTTLGEVEYKDGKAASLDATPYIREGDNLLSIRCNGRIAALLELNGDLARKQWIVSDGSWTTPDKKAVVAQGAVDAGDANPFDLGKAFDAYNSWQLAKAGSQNQATDASSLTLLPGFHAELIHSATPEEGSWVAMAFDPEGRITLAREKKGLLRVSFHEGHISGIEVINDTLLECRGLLYAKGALFAHANVSKGLFRLRDPKRDGHFDEIVELLHTEGGTGHARNHLKLGPDGKIYLAYGNNVLLPANLARSALQHFAPDQLLSNPWDNGMFDGNVELPAGHVLRMNPDGSQVELVAGGFRNPLDIAFDHNGELFTFDADMERDIGASWYMPTRVLQVVPGADYGWRRGTGRFPAAYIETLPSVLDVGLSSPTGVFFGYGAKFPSRYQKALLILDWAYGRILAIHMNARGAGYRGTQETFVSGRPLNVTDGCIGPDGALWFVTGGRGTQSGLYRVTYTGNSVERSREELPVVQLTEIQKERRYWERLAWAEDIPEQELPRLFADLGSSDRFLSHAARTALERLSLAKWTLSGLKGNAWLQGALARVRLDDTAARQEICRGLLQRLQVTKPGESGYGDLLRVLELAFIRLGAPDDAERAACVKVFEPAYPAQSEPWINRELCRLLVYLQSPHVLAQTQHLLASATESEDLVFYPMILRYVKSGWTLEIRRTVFDALNRAEQHNGASTYFKAIQDLRGEFAAALSPEESARLADVVLPKKPAQLSLHALPAHTFKNWKLEDLVPSLDQVSQGRSFERARSALVAAQCVFCHRVSSDPSLPAGIFGPDLSQVSSRFNRRDLLDNILNPSKVIDDKYRNVLVTLVSGEEVSGAFESEDDERLVLRPNPLAPEKKEIAKSMIRQRKLSGVSPMPAGLFNILKQDQILDILAFFEAGGDPQHPVFTSTHRASAK
jgi:putative heme-binding domain-containing protein